MKGTSIRQIKVLVIEDNFIASKAAELLLKSKGCLVDCVYTGKAAIEQLENEDDYDLIVLDLGLPDLHGFEVAKTIRNSKDPLSLVQIVILTAFDVKENRELATQLGISHYLTKPFTLEKCEQILEARTLECCP